MGIFHHIGPWVIDIGQFDQELIQRPWQSGSIRKDLPQEG